MGRYFIVCAIFRLVHSGLRPKGKRVDYFNTLQSQLISDHYLSIHHLNLLNLFQGCVSIRNNVIKSSSSLN